MQNEETIEAVPAPANPETIIDPDNPRWGVLAALAFWLISVGLILFFPVFTLLPYAAYKGIATNALEQFVRDDPGAILVSIVAIIPAHLLTILLSWKIVSGQRKFPYFESLGWQNGAYRWWHGVLILIGMFVLGAVVLTWIPEEENQMIRIIRSSKEAAILLAVIATFSAPFAEEVVYRGILFPAVRSRFGTAAGIGLVTVLFTAVHVPQYLPSYATLTVLLVLSLALTVVRAYSKNLWPCVALHFAFNGLQSIALVVDTVGPKPTLETFIR